MEEGLVDIAGGPGPAHGERTNSSQALGAHPPRRVYFGPEHGWLETPVIGRGDLARVTRGPCIAEEYDATCVVEPGSTAVLDAHGNIVIEVGG